MQLFSSSLLSLPVLNIYEQMMYSCQRSTLRNTL